jgi:uncharacterized protein YjeT (DUF2065 family)
MNQATSLFDALWFAAGVTAVIGGLLLTAAPREGAKRSSGMVLMFIGLIILGVGLLETRGIIGPSHG